MAKKLNATPVPDDDFPLLSEGPDPVEGYYGRTASVALPAHKQTQDRLIKMETQLLSRLKNLADQIETGSTIPVAPVPASPHMSLAAFNKALPSRLTALQDDIVTQIERIETMLF